MNDFTSLPNILFTTELSDEQSTHLKNLGIEFEVEPFISTDYIPHEEWLPFIPNGYDCWIFTSKKAVKAVKPIIGKLPIPPFIFAVGEKTAEKLEELSLKSIIPEEYNLISLAGKMNEYKLSTAIHFCGNRKSGNLSEMLSSEVEIIPTEVYSTKLKSQKIDIHAFDGIVFMSPSAVTAFHQQNKITPDIAVFSIGPSTSKKLKDFEIQNSAQAEKATLESLAETIQNHFKTCHQTN